MFAIKDDAAAKLLSPVFAQVGIYNLALATGLGYAILTNNVDMKLLGLTQVWMAATFASTSVKPAILLSQGSPAALGVIFLSLGEKGNAAMQVIALSLLGVGGVCAALGPRGRRTTRKRKSEDILIKVHHTKSQASRAATCRTWTTI